MFVMLDNHGEDGFDSNTVALAIARQPSRKAVGPDGRPAEAWTAAAEFIVDDVTSLFQAVAESGVIPTPWRGG